MIEMKRYFSCWLAVALFSFTGCAFVTVPLFPSKGPLEEQAVQGQKGPKVLLMNIDGLISDAPDKSLLGTGDPSTVSLVREELQKAKESGNIRGIITIVNSPGGTVTASDIVYHEILRFKKDSNVPVYAIMLDTAASGGYYVSLAADRIYAHPTTITGSIGVISLTLNFEGLMQKIGIQSKVKKSGDKKDIFSPFRADTEEEGAIMQTIVDLLHKRFLDAVEEGRSGRIKRAQIEALADGRPYTAGQALEQGLIDKIGYMDDVIGDMSRELNTDEIRLVRYVRSGDYSGSIYSATAVRSRPDFDLSLLTEIAFFERPDARFLYLWQP